MKDLSQVSRENLERFVKEICETPCCDLGIKRVREIGQSCKILPPDIEEEIPQNLDDALDWLEKGLGEIRKRFLEEESLNK